MKQNFTFIKSIFFKRKKIIFSSLLILFSLYIAFNIPTPEKASALGSLSLSLGGCSGSNRTVNVGYAHPVDGNQWVIKPQIDSQAEGGAYAVSNSTSGSIAFMPPIGQTFYARLYMNTVLQYTTSISVTACPPVCSNDCSPSGYKECGDSTHYRTCGNYDADSCLEWSSSTLCPSGGTCSGGVCTVPCTCTAWASAGCGGSCASTQLKYTRTCNPAGCLKETNCVADVTCGACTDQCSSGQKDCPDSTHYRTCGQYDTDACLDWSPSTACAAGQTCSGGVCSGGTCTCTSWTSAGCGGAGCTLTDLKFTRTCTPSGCDTTSKCVADVTCGACTDQCSSGQKDCPDSTHYRTCGQYDTDTCLDWSSPLACAVGQTCSGAGVCGGGCSNDCSSGQKRCDPANSTRYQTCGQYDTDTCLDWSSSVACSPGQTCSGAGTCSSTTNTKPNTPSRPSGPTSGRTDTNYTFTTSTTDPNGDQIQYGWDWDNNYTVDEWSDLKNSGTQDSRSHSWNTERYYFIRVKAKDSKGLESSWSLPSIIYIKTKISAADVPTPASLVSPVNTSNEGECVSEGAQVTFNWTPANPAGQTTEEQWIDITTNYGIFTIPCTSNTPPYSPAGCFVHLQLATAQNSYVAKVGNPIGPLKIGLQHWWRINTKIGGQWYSSKTTASFTTNNCGTLNCPPAYGRCEVPSIGWCSPGTLSQYFHNNVCQASAICYQENKGAPCGPQSPAGARGLFQIMPVTAASNGIDYNRLCYSGNCSSCDPVYDIQAAVKISEDGLWWGPWGGSGNPVGWCPITF